MSAYVQVGKRRRLTGFSVSSYNAPGIPPESLGRRSNAALANTSPALDWPNSPHVVFGQARRHSDTPLGESICTWRPVAASLPVSEYGTHPSPTREPYGALGPLEVAGP